LCDTRKTIWERLRQVLGTRVSLTGVYCTRRDRLVCTTHRRLHVYHP